MERRRGPFSPMGTVMARHSKPAKQTDSQDPTQGRFSGRLPVIKGKFTRDEVDSTAERTQPLVWTKQAREKGY